MAKLGPKKLAQWRRHEGLTLPAAAEEFGVTRMTYINWENGEVIPREEKVIELRDRGIANPEDWYEPPVKLPSSLIDLMERAA